MAGTPPRSFRNSPRRAATGRRTAAAMPTRANTTTVGSSSRTAILMNRYGIPQIIDIAVNSSQPLRVMIPPTRCISLRQCCAIYRYCTMSLSVFLICFSKGLDTSLTDIDHRTRSGCQRILLPIAVTRADLKPIVEEQGFHLLGKDIAQGCVKRLRLALTSWMQKREMAGVVLDLGHGIVVLLFGGHELPPIRRRVLFPSWTAKFEKIMWGGIACFKEKTSLWKQMFPDASQHRFLVRSRQKELKDIFQHVDKGKLLLEMERARISHHPLNRDGLLRRLLTRSRNHFWCDIHTRHLIAKLRHAMGHTSRSTRQIQQRP